MKLSESEQIAAAVYRKSGYLVRAPISIYSPYDFGICSADGVWIGICEVKSRDDSFWHSSELLFDGQKIKRLFAIAERLSLKVHLACVFPSRNTVLLAEVDREHFRFEARLARKNNTEFTKVEKEVALIARTCFTSIAINQLEETND